MIDPSPSGRPPMPTCKALLICERVIIEAGTGKISVIGIFDRFSLSAFPGVIPPFFVFIQITNAAGRYELTIEVQDLRDDAVLARGAGPEIEIDDRLAKVNVSVPVPGLSLPHAGTYDLVVFVNNEEIDRQSFVVEEGDADASDEAY